MTGRVLARSWKYDMTKSASLYRPYPLDFCHPFHGIQANAVAEFSGQTLTSRSICYDLQRPSIFPWYSHVIDSIENVLLYYWPNWIEEDQIIEFDRFDWVQSDSLRLSNPQIETRTTSDTKPTNTFTIIRHLVRNERVLSQDKLDYRVDQAEGLPLRPTKPVQLVDYSSKLVTEFEFHY